MGVRGSRMPSHHKADRWSPLCPFSQARANSSAVEAAPPGTAEPELSVEALRLRVRQQELLSDFGVLALKGTPFPELLDHAARLVAEGLEGRLRESPEVPA